MLFTPASPACRFTARPHRNYFVSAARLGLFLSMAGLQGAPLGAWAQAAQVWQTLGFDARQAEYAACPPAAAASANQAKPAARRMRPNCAAAAGQADVPAPAPVSRPRASVPALKGDLDVPRAPVTALSAGARATAAATVSCTPAEAGAVDVQAGNPAGNRAAPAAPVVGAVRISPTSVQLTWVDDAQHEHHYMVERSEPGSLSWTVLTQYLPPNSTRFMDTTADAAGPYRYRVSALGAQGRLGGHLITLPASASRPWAQVGY